MVAMLESRFEYAKSVSRVDVNTCQKDDLDLDDLANGKKVGSRLVSRR